MNFPVTVEIWIVWDFSKLVFWFGMIIVSGVLFLHSLRQQWNCSNEALHEDRSAQGKKNKVLATFKLGIGCSLIDEVMDTCLL